MASCDGLQGRPPWTANFAEVRRLVVPCAMRSDAGRLSAALKRHFGHASFWPNQREIIEAILAGRDVFAALPTGGGKSLCYQLPAMILDRLTIVVSPLIALMKDQVDSALRRGIPATFLNSSLTPGESRERWRAVADRRTRLLYVSPERIANEAFRGDLARVGLSLLAVDEAHCISEWGHEFRPDYRILGALRSEFPGIPIAAFTATATRQVQDDIVTLLGLTHPFTVRASFNRPELFYRVTEKADELEQIRAFVASRAGAAGIVYRTTRDATESTARRLVASGIRALPYHAGLDDAIRRQTQEKFLRNEIQVVVATIAFGMGIDKADIRWVVHGDLPRSMEGYYQETGRAGRDGNPAETLLIWGRQDIAKIRWSIDRLESQEERERAGERLREMLRYVESSVCRRQLLLAHFDEHFAGGCEACDVCTGELPLDDFTTQARMILSAAARTGERFGAHYLVDIVTGTTTDRVRERGHDALATFGVGADRDRGFWLSLAHDLEQTGHLVRGDGELAGLRLSAEGRLLLTGKRSFRARHRAVSTTRTGRKPRSPTGAGGSSVSAGKRGRPATLRPDAADISGRDVDNEPLFAALKEARRTSATEEGIPAFVVFHDRTLRAIAARRPTTVEELLLCEGVGEKKAARYGELVLRVIREFLAETDHRSSSP